MRFERNVGQAPSDVRFIAHRAGATLLLEDDGADLDLRTRDRGTQRVGFKVANGRAVTPQASNALPTKVNYLRGNDRADWLSNVATYGKVTYPKVLDGVDLVYHGEEGQLEYDFVVAPGTDPSGIAFDVRGGEGAVSLTDRGDLAIRTSSGVLVQQRPHVYQRDAQGKTQDVAASYRILADARVAFTVASYDRSRELVIDPVVGYAEFLGTTSDDRAAGIAADGSGNAYVVGTTSGFDYPNAHFVGPNEVPRGNLNSADAFVAKIGTDGTVSYFTYLEGQEYDEGDAIAVDATGHAFVTGFTSSDTFPVTDGSFPWDNQDAYILRLSPDGTTAEYGTFLDGGARNIEGSPTNDAGFSIALSNSEVFIGGYSSGAGEFLPPITQLEVPLSQLQQTTGAWVIAFPANATGQGVVPDSTTYVSFGQSVFSESPPSYVRAVALSGNQLAVGGIACDDELSDAVTQATAHSYNTTRNGGSCDAFVARFDVSSVAAPALNYGSVFGSDAFDFGDNPSVYDYYDAESTNGIAIATDGTIYAAGTALVPGKCEGQCPPSELFPTKGVSHGSASSDGPDAFVVHFDPAQDGDASLLFSTLLGGSNSDGASAIILDATNAPYVVGGTYSNDFLGLTGNLPNNTEDSDGFVVALSADGAAILFDSYLGGTTDSGDTALTALAVTPGAIYAAGYSSTTDALAALNPKTSNAGGQGSYDAVVFSYITAVAPTQLVVAPQSAISYPRGNVQIKAAGGTEPYTFTFIADASGGNVNNNGLYLAGSRGSVTDSIRVSDSAGQSTIVNITVGPAITITPGQVSVAAKSTTPVQFVATGGAGNPYTWQASAGTITTTGSFTPPSNTGVVTITVHDIVGNSSVATVSVGGALAVASPTLSTYPLGSVPLTAFGGTPPYTYSVVSSVSHGGTVSSAGIFTAGATGNVTEDVQVTDNAGGHVVVTISVGAALVITPQDSGVKTGGTVAFGAAAGSGSGYKFSISANTSGATIDQQGHYVAGQNTGTDEVLLVDSVGAQARAHVVVSATPPTGNNSSSASSTSGAPTTTTPVDTASSSGTQVSVGGAGGGNDCAVGNVGSSAPTGSAFAGIALGLALAFRRRRRSN